MTGQPTLAWMDGELVDYADAVLHVDTQSVQGGLNAYEVIGGFWSETDDELYLFRFAEHIRRLRQSCKLMRLPISYTDGDLLDAARELLRRNKCRQDVALRLSAYFGAGPLFSAVPGEIPTGVYMVAGPANPELRRPHLHLSTSTWTRLPDLAAPPRIKSGANYQNARLAQVQAKIDGYEDAILLNSSGKVCELPLANLFLVKNGRLITPCTPAGILEGITRLTILESTKDMGLEVEEREVERSELYTADEAFSTGSISFVTPILSIDRYDVGDGTPGPVTGLVQRHLRDLLVGPNFRRSWTTAVYRPERLVAT